MSATKPLRVGAVPSELPIWEAMVKEFGDPLKRETKTPAPPAKPQPKRKRPAGA